MQTNKIATEITRLSLSRKVTVFVLFLTILAVGIIAVNRLPLEKYPRGQEGHYMRIRTGWDSGVALSSSRHILTDLSASQVMSRVPVWSNVIANSPASLSRLPGCGLVSVDWINVDSV